MNKDLDNRLIPNGEYRDANNLQISRSQGSEVGEFENILGNEQLTYLYTGRSGLSYTGKIIGQFTDETNNILYIYSAGYNGSGRCPRDLKVYANPVGDSGTVISLFDAAGNQISPLVAGVQEGMLLWGDDWNGQPSGAGGQEVDPIVTNVTNSNITISQSVTFSAAGPPGNTIYIGFANTIHRYEIDSNLLTLFVRGSFLNFHQDFRIYGVNLIEDLLFWTDNRNQPRKINVSLANPGSLPSPTHYVNEDQISVAKYYPYETPLVLKQTIRRITAGAQDVARKGYSLTMTDTTAINIGDIVTGFPDQESNEYWEVIYIDPGVSVTIYNNFKNGGAGQTPGTYTSPSNISITFSNTTMKNSADRLLERGFDTTVITAAALIPAGTIISVNYDFNNQPTDTTPQPTPQIGDFITSEDLSLGVGPAGITIADEVVITEISSITPGTNIEIKLNKDITINAIGDDISISVNPNYDDQFTGDPDLIEEKFVRFSYRFKFEDNEYSLAAPYTQICFIPKHEGLYGGGKNDQEQDMLNNYESSVLEWFSNYIDTISLKIPLPDNNTTASEAVDRLINNYKVKDIEILYKESDALSTKILEVINVTGTLASFVEEIPNTAPGVGPNWYYNFDYKSIKPYRTLPTSEQNRVYDNVPLKALGQEITGNRVIYGNFLQKHTPPKTINYEVIEDNKSLEYNNYTQYPNHSVKQNRNYQVGFVLSDRYGRASSVVLSSNDDDPNLAGSTIYVPYKSWEDVGGPEANTSTGLTPASLERTYSWLGSVLRVKINNGISQLTNNELTGEPGLYKSEDDTSVDQVVLSGGGFGHAVGDILGFGYPPGNFALGSGLTVEVVSETGGVITGIKIVNRGTGYANGQTLFQTSTTGAGSAAVVETVVFDANPTGWQSYKIVVKQQEQEYYNVYLPGYVSGYPVLNASEVGRVAFAVLLGDNINKVPRDLNEVSPLQREFSASVRLFGRINNPDINDLQKSGGTYYYENRRYAWNTQYFPGRINDEAVTIGTIGADGLQLGTSPFNAGQGAGEFSNSTGSIPWGTTGKEQSFFNQQQAPIAMGLKIGVEVAQPQLQQPGSPQMNTLGARVTDVSVPTSPALRIGCMIPYLSVSETFPVESQLEIFYESSTTGNFVELNRQVTADYGGVTGVNATTGNFDESDPIGTDIITSFSFTDSAGNQLTLVNVPIISQILDSNGNDVTGIFNIVQNGGTPLNFDLRTTQLFWYGALSPTKSNQWQISFETEYNDGIQTYFDTLPNIITVNLNNVAPTIGGFTPAVGPDAGVQQICGKPGGSSGYDSTVINYGQFTNVVNGSADATNNEEELCYSLAVTSFPVGSTATYAIDQSGNVTKTGGTAVNGSYEFECTVTDAAPSCVVDPGSLTTTCTYEIVLGTPPVNQALCFGPTATMASLNTECNWNASGGPGEPIEVFFGAALTTNSIANGTNSVFSTIDASGIPISRQYLNNSNGDTQLRYYNVLQEARFGANAHTCGLPPTTPAFTTGSLVQGVVRIECILSKSATAASPSEYTTDFTILYRPTATDPWQLATYDQVNGGGVPGTIGNLNSLTVVGGAATSTSFVFDFSAVGEYAVRNNGVRGVGCSGCTTCAEFKVDFYDATFGATVAPCIDCVGPL
ncbi:MAG: hypothetical protein ACYTKD_24600 [Planctomycetota bacterium]|jgi:hypothetical protein